MRRLAPILLFVILFIFGGPPAAPPAHASDPEPVAAKPDAAKPEAAKADAAKPDATKADVAKPDAAKAGKAKGPTPGGPKDKSALWWDDPKIVEALSLTDEQRKKMTEHVTSYRKNRPRDRKPEAFQEALVQGDWKAAKSQNQKLAESAAEAVQLRGKLKIDILSLLTKQQLESLNDQHPRLIYQPWRRAMRGAAAR